MKRAREAYPEKYAAAVARKRARRNPQTVQAIVKNELRKKTDWKYTDVGLAGQNVTSAGTISALYVNAVRGDLGTDNFEGNIVVPQAVTLKYFCHTSEIRNVVRVMVFQWFDSTVPVPAGILQNIALPFGVVSPTLVTNKDFIKVLYDKSHQFAPTAGNPVTGEGTTDPVTIYIPGRKLKPTRFQSGLNVVQDGALYILYISDDLVVPSPQITWYSRITFADGQ